MSDLINNNRLSILSQRGGSAAAACGLAGAAVAVNGVAMAGGAATTKFSALDAGPRHWV